MSWSSIVLAVFGAGLLFSYIGFGLKDSKWLFLKLLFFVVGVFLSFLLVFMVWAMSVNPSPVGAFGGVGLSLLLSFILLFVAFIFLFVVVLVRNWADFAQSVLSNQKGDR